MNLDKISVGQNAPWDVNVVIEISQGSSPVKYEIDKESGAVFVDRFMHCAMYYPANYGFIPQTLAQDGDPLDALVVGAAPVIPGSVIRCRPIGVLMMEDESGIDEKILMIPVDKLNPFFQNIKNYTDLQPYLLEQITHFFEHYKDLEKNKWVKVTGYDAAEKAAALISDYML
ncbi:MAG TPA: inorganic diphosphatase [Holosporales bacterium]|nr:inorganic diphosphatase [Holosporales bacterium]